MVEISHILCGENGEASIFHGLVHFKPFFFQKLNSKTALLAKLRISGRKYGIPPALNKRDSA